MGIQPVHEMNCVPVRRWTSSCRGPGRGTLHDEQVGKPILRGAYDRFFTCRVQCPLPWPKTLCQPTTYLAEVTSLSPGLPPQRLPRVRNPHARHRPCQVCVRFGAWKSVGFTRLSPGERSNPDRIESALFGGFTWGSRRCGNPRLREVSPLGNFSDVASSPSWWVVVIGLRNAV
jgi:hypothetical protein